MTMTVVCLSITQRTSSLDVPRISGDIEVGKGPSTDNDPYKQQRNGRSGPSYREGLLVTHPPLRLFTRTVVSR